MNVNLKNYINLVKIETKLIFRIPDVYLIAFGLPFLSIIIIKLLEKNNTSISMAASFGGIVSIGVIGAGVMGLSSIITDNKHNHVLNRLKVTIIKPIQILGATSIGLGILAVTSTLFAALEIHYIGGVEFKFNVFVVIFVYFFTLISTFSIGMIISCLAPNRHIANIVTILIYFPSLLLCGTTIPRNALPKSISIITELLPNTHSVIILQTALENGNLFECLNSFIYLVIIIIVCVYVLKKKFVWDFR